MLVAFGVAVYELVVARQYSQVDTELQARVGALRRIISEARRREELPHRDRGPGTTTKPPWLRGPGGPRFDRPPHGPPPDFLGSPSGPPLGPGHLPQNFILPPETASLFGSDTGFYFAIWSRDSAILRSSPNAPSGGPQPTALERDLLPHLRTWATYRELLHCSGAGDCVVVGRSIAGELRNATAVAWLLPLAGATVLLMGLVVGWWLITRAVRPIELIEITAEEISCGKLSARVPVNDPDNELGRLSSTLNATFGRLEAAFERQKQFTSDAAHELRTPLAIMISEAQTSLARQRSADEYKQALEDCLDTAQQMRRLTDTLLDLARLDVSDAHSQRTEIDLADVALHCIKQLQPMASTRQIRMKHNLSEARVVNLAERMVLVVSNLILNAIIYNQTGGEVIVTTTISDTHATVTIADTGIGIGPVDLPHIYDRFYRADKVRSQTGGHAGLGLSICKAILEAENGTIEVQSEVGMGTMFTVRLPVRR